MTRAGPHDDAGGRFGRRLGGGAILAGLLALGLWAGCGVTPSNYKALSFFFDGVPNPSLRPGTQAGDGVQAPRAMASVHVPYVQESCGECHTARLRMPRNDSGFCLKCHEGKEREHARTHGPVAARACLWCHHPHESAQLHLLRDVDRVVCAQCHTPEMLDTSRTPEHADEARGCLECHVGHGSSKAYLLRANAGAPSAPHAAPQGKGK